ncbi:hypothetical protein GQ53DRAFT_767061 [Thozetella sp. PMI_491]|nr:hypothetical protein GQ53DRAFT_767061 [Thozetella sp. PMI_491]
MATNTLASCLRTRQVSSSTYRFHMPRIQWGVLLLVIACFICQAAAVTADLPTPTETLVLDPRIRGQEDGVWTLMSREELRRRDDTSSQPTEILPGTVSTTFDTGVSTPTPTQVSTTVTAESSPLPSPFDSNLSANFSKNENNVTTCPTFINSFLTDPTFKQCYPFSLLLQGVVKGSKSFFNAEKSLVSITQVLDASCAANATKCTTYMNNLAKNLTQTANCGTDYQLGNSVVVQAYIAMIGYKAVYDATCLKDTETAQYCYANAITNLTTPSNVYFYYLPLNLTLPGSTIPSCSDCTQQTMNVFQNAAANRQQPIALTYVSAAQQVNTICGPGFVNETLPLALVVNGAPGLAASPSWLLLGLSMVAALHWLL